MKKNYIEPNIEVVKLNATAPILSGSVTGTQVTVSEDPYNSADDEVF